MNLNISIIFIRLFCNAGLILLMNKVQKYFYTVNLALLHSKNILSKYKEEIDVSF